MKSFEELEDRFESIPELPVSEEMLGAYMDGLLLENSEAQVIEAFIYENSYLSEIPDDTVTSHGQIGSVFGEEFHFTEPENNFLNDNMIEDISISHISPIYEAEKQFGLEPLNIDFDPNTFQWEQDTCAIRSQEIVLRSFGKFVSQEDLINQAKAHGWYSPGNGTPMNAVGNLLDLYEVPNHRVENANVFNLADELGHGHKVIVGVDINELYGNSFWQSIKESLVGKTPNHAMIVSGLDTSDPNCLKVILTDPGTGKTLFECPYDKFLSAWNDSNCFMVATDDPAPLTYNPDTMINFDYSNGHVASLGDIPFKTFHEEIVPGANEYIDSLDQYIDALERTMDNGFNLDDFNDMMHKADIAHQNAVTLHNNNSDVKNLHREFMSKNINDADDINHHHNHNNHGHSDLFEFHSDEDDDNDDDQSDDLDLDY